MWARDDSRIEVRNVEHLGELMVAILTEKDVLGHDCSPPATMIALRSACGWALLSGRRDICDRQIPVRRQNLEPALLLALVGCLVRPKLLD
jgi:hypothetical protein